MTVKYPFVLGVVLGVLAVVANRFNLLSTIR